MIRVQIKLLLSLYFFLVTIVSADGCGIVQEQNYGAIGDTSGKDIFTKVEYTYECNTTRTSKGECIEWRVDSNRHMSLPEDKPVVFKDEDFTGGLGQMALIFAGYSQLDHIWSGWKGICYDGVLEDFGWVSDPMMWANMLAQAMGADAGAGEGEEAFLDELSDYAGYAQCTIQMGASIGEALQEYQEDEIPCDPIDEFCGDENDASDERVMSVTREAYEKLVTENPDYAKYVKIVREEDGILIIKIIQPEDDTSHISAEEAAEAMKKIKEIMLAVKTAFIAYDAYNCYSTASGGVSNALGANTNDTNPTQSVIMGGISRSLSQMGCVPCSIGFTLIVNIVNSFNDVDTCSDENDAREQGQRHLATFSHKREKMCHFIRKETEEGIFFDLDKYFYCCYDDVFSRILAEQFKAQYAKNWNSCSDVTLKEIVNLKMSPCKKTIGVDPASLAWNASYDKRKTTWQFQEKCVDFTELAQYLSEKFNVNINQDTIYDQLEDLKDNIPK